ncbi:MAG TPA: hypothetical protein VM782_00755 [Stellaceae bacterium]|nr:hypothetical protein [Stellaceae bacterium]
MLKPTLICATLGGMMCVATSSFAATPAVPTSTMLQNTAIEHQNPAIKQAAFWWRGRSYPYRWRGAFYRNRAWRNGGWRYW